MVLSAFGCYDFDVPCIQVLYLGLGGSQIQLCFLNLPEHNPAYLLKQTRRVQSSRNSSLPVHCPAALPDDICEIPLGKVGYLGVGSFRLMQ